MRIGTFVNRDVVWADADEPLVVLARRMRDRGVGSLPVRDRGRLAGIVTECDVVAAVADGLPLDATPARACMTPEPAVAGAAEDCADVAGRMLWLGLRHVLVVDRGRVIGVASARDLLMLEAWPNVPPPSPAEVGGSAATPDPSPR
jgi:CBS domain-containing protein